MYGGSGLVLGQSPASAGRPAGPCWKSKAGTWYYVFVDDKAFWENLPQVLHGDRLTGARHAAEMRSRICVRLDTAQGELLLCMHAYV